MNNLFIDASKSSVTTINKSIINVDSGIVVVFNISWNLDTFKLETPLKFVKLSQTCQIEEGHIYLISSGLTFAFDGVNLEVGKNAKVNNPSFTTFSPQLNIPNQGELKMQEMLLMFQQFLNKSSDALLVSNEEGKMIYLNEIASELLGISQNKISNYNTWDIEPLFQSKSIWSVAVKSLKKDGDLILESVSNFNPSGKEVPVEITFTYQLINGKGYIIFNSRNITERKKSEQQLQESEARHRYMVEASKELICFHELDGTYKFVPQSVKNLVGYDSDYLIGKKPYDFFHLDDVEHFRTKANEALGSGLDIENLQYRYRTKEGKYIWLDTYLKVIYNENGAPGSLLSGSRDVSDLKQTELELNRREEMIANIANNIPGIIMRLEYQEERIPCIQYISDGVGKLIGIEKHEIIEEPSNFFAKLHPSDKKEFIISFVEASREFTQLECIFRITTNENKIKWISCLGQPIKGDGEIVLWDLIALDVTDQKNAEIELSRSQEFLSNLSNNIPGLIFQYILKADGTDEIKYISKGAEDIWELTIDEMKEDSSKIWSLIVSEDLPEVQRSLEESRQKMEVWENHHRILMDDGHVKWLHCIGQPKRLPKNAVQWDCVILEVTERKNAELELKKTLQQLNLGIATASLGIWEHTLQTDAMIWNTQQNILFEYEPEYRKLNMSRYKEFIHKEDLAYFENALSSLIEGNREQNIRYRIVTKNKEVKHIISSGAPIWDENGKVVGVLGINQDLSSIVKAQFELERVIQEKELLFRELHHRIKNNLQMVNSLLYLKGTYDNNVSLRDFIKETSVKINSISAIHENLLQIQGLQELNVNKYLGTLCDRLVKTYSDRPGKYELEMNVVDELFDIDTVLNLGLIINEIVSNSIKHAYSDEGGPIFVHLIKENEKYSLVVKDEGKGLKENNEKLRESYGLELIRLFVKQLRGELKIDSTGGTSYYITFPNAD